MVEQVPLHEEILVGGANADQVEATSLLYRVKRPSIFFDVGKVGFSSNLTCAVKDNSAVTEPANLQWKVCKSCKMFEI
jgi:hypothetical protein